MHKCVTQLFFSMSQQQLDILTSSLGGCGRVWARSSTVAMETMSFPVRSYHRMKQMLYATYGRLAQHTLPKMGTVGANMEWCIGFLNAHRLSWCCAGLFCSAQVFKAPLSSTHRPYLCRQLKHSCTRFKASSFIKTTVVLMIYLKFIQAKKL